MQLAAVRAQPQAHVIIEMLEQQPAGVAQSSGDDFIQFALKRVKRLVDLALGPAGLIDVADASLEIAPVIERAEDFIGLAEEAVEQTELLVKELEQPRVRGVFAVQKVDDDHVELLAVAVAAADALLDLLRVPWQIVVDDHVAELEVEALGAGTGGDE